MFSLVTGYRLLVTYFIDPMPPKPPSLYNLDKTTIVFALASVALFVGLFAMVLQDSGREWKAWQRQFMAYSRQQAEKQLEETRKKTDSKALEELQSKLRQAHQDIQTHRNEIHAIRRQLGKLEVELIKATTRYQDIKQIRESVRYFFEEARAHDRKDEAEKYQSQLAKRALELEKARLEMDEAQARVDAKNAGLSKFVGAEQTLSRDITQLLLEQTILEKKIQKLKPDWVKVILNAPMLDFIRPTFQIQQIVVENLYDDFYFSKAQKVDRCITCHLGIDQKNFEGAPAPFKAHPHLDLFLSSNSPHPMEKFGCTTCHGGSGHSVNFTTAAHTPQNEAQAKEWEKKYGWHEMQHWTEKMLPAQHLEAACAKCHQGVSKVPQAPQLNEGRRLAETYGCFACHKVEGLASWSASGGKVGPSLMHVQSKLEQDWIVRWLQNPKEFRPSTKMPRIFHLSNTLDLASAEKNNAVIAGIASYLIKNSDPMTLTTPPVKGDAAKGEQLVKELGCTGCHTVAGQAANDHGPELSGLGSKVKPEWLYTWLKNPRLYHPETRMPNLRLSDDEASHMTSYLLSLRNEKFESLQLPLVKPETVEELAISYLAGTLRQDEVLAELNKLTPEQKLEFVGKKAIAHQGCFGCHDIKGFENTKPIGTELTEEGSKDIHKLYFGFVPIPHTRQDWFFQKLKEPRIFDQGKELPYLEKARMPQFDFTDEQAEALVSFLLSQQKAFIPKEMHKELDWREQQIEAGRLIVNKFNCNGCHTLDGKEGSARELFEDKGNAPPILDGEGRKVQAAWLYDFLRQPSTIRPWLKYRMPTFGFSDEQIAMLVQYLTQLDMAPPAFSETKHPATTPEEMEAGRKLFRTFQCIKCHKSSPEPGLTASFLAPDLVMTKDRLRQDWVMDWIKDPQAIQPGTMMPTFFAEGQSPVQDILGGDAVKQIKAMRDYLWIFTPEEAAAMQPPPVPAKK